MKKRLLGLLGLSISIVACANEVIIEDPNGNESGSLSSSSGSSSSGSSSSSTSSGAPAVCTPNDQDPQPTPPTCAELDRIVLVDPVIAGDTDGDGRVEPGETATITVTMREISGYGFNWYPGVEFASTNLSVGVTADSWYYAILPCGEQPATATVKIDPAMVPGKTAIVQASVNMLNGECKDTFTLEILVEIQ